MLKEFAERPQWVVYRRATKTPINPQAPQINVDGQNPANWTTGTNAQAWASHLGPDYGVGFVITAGCGIACVDIDKALVNGQWSPLASELCARFAGAYIEVSQSGSGLHIFFSYRNEIPAHKKKNVQLHIEFYDELRFIGVTGTLAAGSPTFDATAILPKLISDYFEPTSQQADPGAFTTEPHASWDGPEDDAELIERACASKGSAGAQFGLKATFADLHNNDVAKLAGFYPSQTDSMYDGSSVDQAYFNMLAFWTGGNCERMARIANLSALVRDKWNRPDYIPRTAIEACAGRTDYYRQSRPPVGAAVEPERLAAPVLSEPVANGALAPMPPPPEGVAAPLPPNVAPVEPGPAVGIGAVCVLAAQRQMFEGCMYVKDIDVVMLPEGMTRKSSQFDNDRRFKGRTYLISNDGTAPSDSAWQAFTQSKIYDFPQVESTVFEPKETPGAILERDELLYINTWRPINIECTPGDAALYADHIKKIFPNGDDAIIYTSFVAACVQHLGTKAAWALFIQGAPGNGKSFLTKVLSYCLGNKYVHSASAANLDNHFNGYLYRKLLICVEEVMTTEGKASTWEKLKTMITETRQEIEMKGVDQITREVCFNMIFNSNHKDGLRKTADDRRICPLYCAQQSAEDLIRDGMGEEYFKTLFDWFDGPGAAIVLDYLRTFPIPDKYNFAKGCHRAPRTTSTDEAISAGLGSVEQDIQEAIKAGRAGFKGGWISSNALNTLLTEVGKAKFIARNKRREMLSTLGYVPHPMLTEGRMPVPLNDGTRPTIYVQRGSMGATVVDPSVIKSLYENAQR